MLASLKKFVTHRRVPTLVLQLGGHAINRLARVAPTPVKKATFGLEVEIWNEIWSRNFAAELARRGFGRSPRA